MRKILAVLLAAMMVLGAVACSNDTEVSSSIPDLMIEDVEQTTTTAQGADEEISTTAGRRPTVANSSTQQDSSDSTKTTASKDNGNKDNGKSDPSTSSGNGSSVTNWEKPVTYNTAILYNPQSSSYDADAEKKRLSIVNSKSAVGPSADGKTYYVSPKGNDDNDGLSPANAWRTPENLHSIARFRPGDVVLFERGAVYRGYVYMASGVSYGAYGDASLPKPAIYGSVRNYADPSLWKETKRENVWKLDVGVGTPDVGNIVFNHGRVCASDFKQTENVLAGDFQFYHDEDNGVVYMYLSMGNPGDLYNDIEVCVKRPVFGRLNGAEVYGVTVDNLCLKYSGSFGIVFNKTSNITVTNCEIGYIGGSMMNEEVRYGNGIEFNSHVETALIKDNWIYQCYDAGYTNQGRGAKHNNIHVTGNLVEYCNYNFEIFCGNPQSDGTYTGLMTNCVFENNVLRFAGYGFGTNNRLGSSDIVASNICYWYSFEPSKDTYIRGNVLDTAYRYLLVAAYVNDQHELAPIVTGNMWIQHKDEKKPCAVALQVDTKVHGWKTFDQHVLSSKSLADMTASVKKIDKSPAGIRFEG